MDQNNSLLLFFQEIMKRLFSKSPKFFKIWQILAASTSAVTGLPGFITMLGIQLPPVLLTLENKTVAIAGLMAWFIARMPIQSPAIVVTTDGALVKKADDSATPFTAQTEKSKALQQGLAGSTTLKEVIDSANK